MAGVHDLFRRFSHSLSPGIWTKVKGSSNEGHGPLEVRSPGAFLCSLSALEWGIFRPGLQPNPQRLVQSDMFLMVMHEQAGYAAMS